MNNQRSRFKDYYGSMSKDYYKRKFNNSTASGLPNSKGNYQYPNISKSRNLTPDCDVRQFINSKQTQGLGLLNPKPCKNSHSSDYKLSKKICPSSWARRNGYSPNDSCNIIRTSTGKCRANIEGNRLRDIRNLSKGKVTNKIPRNESNHSTNSIVRNTSKSSKNNSRISSKNDWNNLRQYDQYNHIVYQEKHGVSLPAKDMTFGKKTKLDRVSPLRANNPKALKSNKPNTRSNNSRDSHSRKEPTSYGDYTATDYLKSHIITNINNPPSRPQQPSDKKSPNHSSGLTMTNYSDHSKGKADLGESMSKLKARTSISLQSKKSEEPESIEESYIIMNRIIQSSRRMVKSQEIIKSSLDENKFFTVTPCEEVDIN